MGDFSDIKSISKYAARMGQCFSSTRYIARLPVDDIKPIDDIIRNKYTFSDGIGKISYTLSKKIAETLELKTAPNSFCWIQRSIMPIKIFTRKSDSSPSKST